MRKNKRPEIPAAGVSPGKPAEKGSPVSLGYFFKAGAALEPQGEALYGRYEVMRTWCDQAAGWLGIGVDELLSLEIRTDELAHIPLLRSIVVSLGIVDVLEAAGVRARSVGGYSSGVMVASCVAGGIERKDLLSLARRMMEAPDLSLGPRPQGLAQLAFPRATPQREIDWYYGDVWPEVYLAADSGLTADGEYRMITVSGYLDVLERLATHMPADRALVYPSFGALHSPLSRPLRDFMEPHVRRTRFHDPRLPLFTGFRREPVTTAAEVAGAFVRNYTDPIWLGHLHDGMRQAGVRVAVAPGPGKPLQMSVLRWPFEVLEVLTPDDVADALLTLHDLALL
ncbi:hypothetical protein [Thermocatellispora tengchongensis]|nr:hypothetical protein [Thermocatellispora tengchongensis]